MKASFITIVDEGQTVNGPKYVEILGNLKVALIRKRPQLIQHGTLLLHDNAPCHTLALTQQFLARNNMTQLSHPPYSPDMAPCDFWFFPRLKSPLKGRHFLDREELIRATDDAIRDLTKDGLLFVFEKWIERMRKCIELEGSYVEKEQLI